MIYCSIFAILIHSIKASTRCSDATDCSNAGILQSLKDDSTLGASDPRVDDFCIENLCTIQCSTAADDCAAIAASLVASGLGGRGLDLYCDTEDDTNYYCVPTDTMGECTGDADCELGIGSLAYDEIVSSLANTTFPTCNMNDECSISCADEGQTSCDDAQGIAVSYSDDTFIGTYFTCESDVCESSTCTTANEATDCAEMTATLEAMSITGETGICFFGMACLSSCEAGNCDALTTAGYADMAWTCTGIDTFGFNVCYPETDTDTSGDECTTDTVDTDCTEMADLLDAIEGTDAALAGEETVVCIAGHCTISCSTLGDTMCDAFSATIGETLTCDSTYDACAPEDTDTGSDTCTTDTIDTDCTDVLGVIAVLDGQGITGESAQCIVGNCAVSCSAQGDTTCAAVSDMAGMTLLCNSDYGVCVPEDTDSDSDVDCETAANCTSVAEVLEGIESADATLAGEDTVCISGHCTISCSTLGDVMCEAFSMAIGETLTCDSTYDVCSPEDTDDSGFGCTVDNVDIACTNETIFDAGSDASNEAAVCIEDECKFGCATGGDSSCTAALEGALEAAIAEDEVEAIFSIMMATISCNAETDACDIVDHECDVMAGAIDGCVCSAAYPDICTQMSADLSAEGVEIAIVCDEMYGLCTALCTDDETLCDAAKPVLGITDITCDVLEAGSSVKVCRTVIVETPETTMAETSAPVTTAEETEMEGDDDDSVDNSMAAERVCYVGIVVMLAVLGFTLS